MCALGTVPDRVGTQICWLNSTDSTELEETYLKRNVKKETRSMQNADPFPTVQRQST